jgi:uncharacterized membrane protein
LPIAPGDRHQDFLNPYGAESTMQLAIYYISTAIVFLGVDFVWLRFASEKLYRPALGAMLLEKPLIGAAIAFYLLYVAGVTIFVGAPALRAGSWSHATLFGGLLGLFCYATYDLTNLATLRNWTITITVLDLLWGAFLTGFAATVGYFVTNAIVRR